MYVYIYIYIQRERDTYVYEQSPNTQATLRDNVGTLQPGFVTLNLSLLHNLFLLAEHHSQSCASRASAALFYNLYIIHTYIHTYPL